MWIVLHVGCTEQEIAPKFVGIFDNEEVAERIASFLSIRVYPCAFEVLEMPDVLNQIHPDYLTPEVIKEFDEFAYLARRT